MARGPHPTRGGSILSLKMLIDLNLARETQIKAQCGPRTKIVARP